VVKHLSVLHGIQGASGAAVLADYRVRDADGLMQKWLHSEGARHDIGSYWSRPHQGSGENNRDVFLEIHDVAKDCEAKLEPASRRKLFPASRYMNESLETWEGLVAPEEGDRSSSKGSLPSSEEEVQDEDDELEEAGPLYHVRDKKLEEIEENEFEAYVDRIKQMVHRGEDEKDVEDVTITSSGGYQSDEEPVVMDDTLDALDLAEERLKWREENKRNRMRGGTTKRRVSASIKRTERDPGDDLEEKVEVEEGPPVPRRASGRVILEDTSDDDVVEG
jgi:hypothetical protein